MDPDPGGPKKTCGSGGSGTLISWFANLQGGDILSLEEGGMNVGKAEEGAAALLPVRRHRRPLHDSDPYL
jgi:hypothetical protein